MTHRLATDHLLCTLPLFYLYPELGIYVSMYLSTRGRRRGDLSYVSSDGHGRGDVDIACRVLGMKIGGRGQSVSVLLPLHAFTMAAYQAYDSGVYVDEAQSGAGEVVFQRSDAELDNIFDADAWDDSALIKAFNESMVSHPSYPHEDTRGNRRRRSAERQRSKPGGRERSRLTDEDAYRGSPREQQAVPPRTPAFGGEIRHPQAAPPSPASPYDRPIPPPPQQYPVYGQRGSPTFQPSSSSYYGLSPEQQRGYTDSPQYPVHRREMGYRPPPVPPTYIEHAHQTAFSFHADGSQHGNPAARVLLPAHDPLDKNKALADLLLSWYYSGYQAGRYHAVAEMQHHGGSS